jgi:predicted tellurium resistance membrane protein TerC
MQITDWLVPLLTLTVMEVVLGIDNVVFLAILVSRLPPRQQDMARQLGLGLALGTRLLLLLALSWMLRLTQPLFSLSDLGLPAHCVTPETNQVSGRDLILLAGGLFLIFKGVQEIHDKLEGASDKLAARGAGRFGWTLAQIAVLDVVFSLDSVITAIGMARQISVMVTAMVLAVGIMLVASGPISGFVHRHPTLRMLALSFLILIGVMLVAEGIEKNIERGYLYFAMLFALAVELLNLRVQAKTAPVELHEPQPPTGQEQRMVS